MSTYDKASLVLIPSGTKEGVCFSQKPTNGDGDFTFTRASSATRVNSDGLIEKETQNLLLHSNTFDTTWIVAASSISFTSGQSGYDGSSDAWQIDKSLAGGYFYQSVTFGGVTTFSVYAKAGTLNWIRLRIQDSVDKYYDLSTGSLGSSTLTTGLIDSSIESVGGGWYRCSLVVNLSSSSTARIYPAQADSDVSATSGNIYIQDAQLNQGLVADSYLETTTTAVYGGITDNIPRLDYTDASCPSLLLEPQRTNLITQSEYLEGSEYNNYRTSVDSNQVLSPEGVINASTLIEDSSTNTHLIRYNTSTLSGDYTISIFVKDKGDDRDLAISTTDNTGQYIICDLANGTITTAVGTINNDIQNYGDGWYRVIVTFNLSSSTFIDLRILQKGYNSIPSNNLYQGDGTSGFYLYGFQLEEASYATSYIPTYGASVTRVGDACSKTGVADLIGDSEGTIFFEGSFSDVSVGAQRITLSDGTSNNRVVIFTPAGNINAFVVSGGVSTGNFGGTSVSSNVSYKIAVKYSQDDFSIWLNGVEIGTVLNGSTFTDGVLTDLKLSGATGSNPFYGNIKQLSVFPTALTDEEAIALTTI